MDIIITYVNGQDPLWQADYGNAVGKSVIAKRFRDWKTLRYLMRAIERNIPFAGKVHLVVARESQVPEWVNREKVNVVLHRDIIPEEFLPVFNSSSIEMFLHRIPGLSEEVLYLNDDFFPIRPCRPGFFFENGKAVTGMSRQLLVAGNEFRYLVKHSDRMARKAAGKGCSLTYLRPQHICYALLKSSCDELYAAFRDEIHASVTKLRQRVNYNIYMYLDYSHFLGRTIDRRLSKKHFSLAVADVGKICSFLRNPDRDFVCINDVEMSEDKFLAYQREILSAFEDVFPNKSAYEL